MFFGKDKNAIFIASRMRSKQGSFSGIIAKIAIGSVALGLFVMIISFMIYKGFRGEIESKIFSFSPHIFLTKYDLNNSFKDKPVSKNSQILQNWQEIPNLASVETYAEKAGLIKFEKDIWGVVIRGIGSESDSNRFKKNIIKGEFLNFPEDTYSKDILISEKIANKLRLKPGDQPIVYFLDQERPKIRRLTVSGIYFTGIEDFDERVVLGDIRLLQKLNHWNDSLVGGIGFYVSDMQDLEESFEEVYQEMDYNLQIGKVTSRFSHLFDWFVMLNRNVYLFITIILFVACFNIVSIMLILILERTSMIGSLKSMGATNWFIQKIFIANGLKLTFYGMALGNAAAIGFGLIQKHFKIIPLDPEAYYMDAVPILIDWQNIFLMNILLFIIIIVILIVPTIVITSVSPIKAIRFN